MFTIRGIPTNFKENVDLDIVRIATGGTYDDPGQRIGEDAPSRCASSSAARAREAARFAFELARRNRQVG